MEMQRAMESLKESVNKVAVLASETSIYLTQNVDRLTSEMRIYDEATEQLVESNLAAEREMKEQRINETIDLARTEYGHFEEARGNRASTAERPEGASRRDCPAPGPDASGDKPGGV
jgi:hypothetical protein